MRHAFIRKRHGAISTFDAPGAGTADEQGTVCVAIARDGRTLGYMIDGSGALHGFLRARDGTFTALDIPGTTQASAGLFDGRRLIGDFHDSNNAIHSFIYGPGGAIKQIDDPNAGTGSSQGTTVSDIGRRRGDGRQLCRFQPRLARLHPDALTAGGRIEHRGKKAGCRHHLPLENCAFGAAAFRHGSERRSQPDGVPPRLEQVVIGQNQNKAVMARMRATQVTLALAIEERVFELTRLQRAEPSWVARIRGP